MDAYQLCTTNTDEPQTYISEYKITLRTHFLLAGVIKEVVSWLSEEPVVVELVTLSVKPFQMNF